MKEVCYKCKLESPKLFKTFGKFICKPCLDARKTGIKGHSGMVYKKVDEGDFNLNNGLFGSDSREIELIRVKKSNPLFVKWFIEHYPKSKGIVGRQLNFLIYSFGKPCGIIGFASPPLNYIKFNTFFGFTTKIHSENSKLFLNNNVFRIVHSNTNLATRVLKIARNEIKLLYEEIYGDKLLGLVTFVEKPRTGSIYKADNWELIGETQGVEVKRRGDDWMNKQYSVGEKKLIFGYKYKKAGKDKYKTPQYAKQLP